MITALLAAEGVAKLGAAVGAGLAAIGAGLGIGVFLSGLLHSV